MKRIPTPALMLVLLVIGRAAIGEDQPKNGADVPDVVKGITARELGGHMKFLASDLLRGRDTASPETRIAAEYLASRLSAAGAEPAGEAVDGKKTYFQKFPLEVITPQAEGTTLTVVFEKDGGKKTVPCKLGTDFFMIPYGLSPGEIEAPIVFAGYGRDDDYAGLDVKGKIVLVFDGDPPKKEEPKAEEKKDEPKKDEEKKDVPKAKAEPKARPRMMRASNPFVKREPAAKRGALGVLVVQPPSSDAPAAARPIRQVFGFGRPTMTLGHTETAIPVVSVVDAIRDQILTPSDPGKPRALEGVTAKFVFAGKKEMKDDRNVVGLFPGSDPEKAKEVVIYSAHYDHVGVGADGQIFNGSDDNASGTSGLLEIAEAFGDGPKPARSVAFLWVSGEEKGLFGSEWFSDHVTLPDGYKIVADINLDMISRNDGKSIGITPSDKHPDHSTLIPMARAACLAEGMTIKFDADQYYGATDSYNFARKGIPVVFFFCGIHEDYHRPTDDFTKADFEKAARTARAAYRLGWQVAQAPDAPKKIKAEAASK
jgi:hypothetical protein